MKIYQFITCALLLWSTYSYSCGTAEAGYDGSATIYSVCPNFPQLPNDSASKLVNVLLTNYKGPPDEIIIYFVASKEQVGKQKFEHGELLGYYYTHSHEIVVWPNSPKEKIVNLTWSQ